MKSEQEIQNNADLYFFLVLHELENMGVDFKDVESIKFLDNFKVEVKLKGQIKHTSINVEVKDEN